LTKHLILSKSRYSSCSRYCMFIV